MKHRKIIIDATVYTFAIYLIQPITIISSLFVRHALGPYLTGVVSTLSLFVYYASFSHLGVLSAAERDLPYYRGSGDMIRYNRIVSCSFTMTFWSGVLFALGMIVWATISRSSLSKSLFLGALIYALNIIIVLWAAYYITLLRTSKQFVYLSKVQVIIGLVASFGNAISAFLFGFEGLLVSTIFTGLLQAFLLTRFFGSIPSFKLDWLELKRLLLAGIPLLILGLAMTGIKTIDNIMTLRFLGTEALGIYSIALMANNTIFSITNSLSVVLYPRMQEAYGKDSTIKSLISYVIRPSIIMGVLLPLLISVLFFLVPPVIYWLLPRFASGIPSFKLIAILSYFLAMFPMSVNFLVSMNKQLKVVAFLMAAIAITYVLAKTFIDAGWGLEGIAMAIGGGYIFCFISINAHALSYWAKWKEIIRFLWDLSVPLLYSAILFVLLDRYVLQGNKNLIYAFFLGLLKVSIFCLFYVPLFFAMERKTRLISDFIKPLIIRTLHLRLTS